ncbi:MAG: hypothetical protein CVU12_08680 [Bacteroidetes bacterium HGW-Bacteroidetes-7]|jgi:hypothetical protein|nr:MAG: hypothetical protein CVU12_08680 [Bacteroidetes bacterium HGW-Bacteroidetes-7]
MRKLIILLTLIMLSANLFAQSSDRKGFIGITIGPSIPIGDFADNSLNNDNAGYAKTGLNINLINFGYKFGQNFGITGLWFGAAHSVDFSAVDAMWSYGGLMGGPMLSFPINEKLIFDLKGMIGFVSAKLDMYALGETSGIGVGFDFGASFRYNFSEKWCLLINGDYLASTSKFDEGDQKISTINLSLGIAFRLK